MLKRSFSKIAIIFAGIGLAVLIFAPSYFFYSKYQKAQKLLKDPSYIQKQEVKSLVEKVGKLIDLPEGEEPTIATVSDKEKLSAQPFFSKAENGDHVLIYTKAKKAVLYRPSTNKIIEVGPVNIGQEETKPATPSANPVVTVKPTTVSTARIAIYNGSKTAGLAASTEAKLKTKFNNITIVEKGNSSGDYDKSLVSDLSGSQKSLTSDIAAYLGGEIKSFPTSETKPDADILVIVVN